MAEKSQTLKQNNSSIQIIASKPHTVESPRNRKFIHLNAILFTSQNSITSFFVKLINSLNLTTNFDSEKKRRSFSYNSKESTREWASLS